jgi:hypothetical protein
MHSGTLRPSITGVVVFSPQIDPGMREWLTRVPPLAGEPLRRVKADAAREARAGGELGGL